MTDQRFGPVVDGAPLGYVSDYFSFVGADSRGRVAFALDNNRGYDEEPPGRRGARAERLQAEHAYAVLHDELTGWVPLRGAVRYPHAGARVTELPDSSCFTFTGGPDDGMTLSSAVNDLQLTVAPLADRVLRRDDSTLFVMRSAAAVLQWRGRNLAGRVIYEGLATTGMNLLSRRTFSGLGGLEFLYLLTGQGEQAGDLYLQKRLGGRGLAGMEPELGFLAAPDAPGGTGTELHGVSISTTAHRPAPGLYRWPVAWTAGWTGAGSDSAGPRGHVELRTASRTTIGRYGVAGFAMAVVVGSLTAGGGTTQPLYGFGELLAGGPVLRALARRRQPSATKPQSTR